MKKEITSDGKSAELRRRAVQELMLAKTKISEMQIENKAEVKILLHELEVHQIELEMQNDELRKAQASIEESRQKYFELYNFAPIGYLSLDSKGTILELNLMAASMLGDNRVSIIDKNIYSYITHNDRDVFYLHLEKIQRTKDRQFCDLRLQRRDGTEFYGHVVCLPIQDENDEISGYRTTIIDISERKQAEEQIKKDLKEKTTLLQEIFHRTKNSMQLVISMLKMQARRSDNEYVNTTFSEIINKINAMSLIHQMLYNAKDLSQINLKKYIEDLIILLKQSYSQQTGKISLHLEQEDVFTLIDSAVPLGLVLNELISNIFKHAFPHRETGEISIRLYREENGTINIHLADNGIGIPAEMDLRKTSSMGLNTMFSLVDHQLRGDITYAVDNGLKWHITFQDTMNKRRV